MSKVCIHFLVAMVFVLVADEALGFISATVPVPSAGVGNTFTTTPFGSFVDGMPSMRYQQIYSSPFFGAALPEEGAMLTRISFRMDEMFGRDFQETVENVQINVSTTQKTPQSLSSVYSENVGLDDAVVFSLGPLELIGDFHGSDELQFWSSTINLQEPFFFYPAHGNLLLDIRIYEGWVREDFEDPITVYYDAADSEFDGVARIWSDSVNDSVAEFSDTVGLVTLFTFRPVPEPSTLLLWGLGAVALTFLLGIKRRSR